MNITMRAEITLEPEEQFSALNGAGKRLQVERLHAESGSSWVWGFGPMLLKNGKTSEYRSGAARISIVDLPRQLRLDLIKAGVLKST
jgi:hypothetical protein